MAYPKRIIDFKNLWKKMSHLPNMGKKKREKNTLPDFGGVKTSDKIKTNGWPAYLSQNFMFPETNYNVHVSIFLGVINVGILQCCCGRFRVLFLQH